MAKKVVGEDGKSYKVKKPFYKKVWFWLLVVVVIIGVGSQMGGSKGEAKDSASKTTEKAKTTTPKDDGISLADFEAIKLSETEGTAKADLVKKFGKADSSSETTVESLKAEDLVWNKVADGDFGANVIIGFSNDHAISKAITGIKVKRDKKIDLATFESIQNGMSQDDLYKKLGKPNSYSLTEIAGYSANMVSYTSDIKGDMGANFNVTISNGAVAGKSQTSMK